MRSPASIVMVSASSASRAVSCMTPIMVVPALLATPGQQLHDALLGRFVQRGGRLVQQEQTRPRRQGAGQVDALLLAAMNWIG